MSNVQYCCAVVEDLTIFFELTSGQCYGEGTDLVPIHWVKDGQVFEGELLLEDIITLDIQGES
jgi:hypothetical protein